MAPPMKGPGGPGEKNKFQKPENTKATFTRLLGYLGKSKSLLILVFIFVAFSALAAIIGTSFVETVIDEVLLPLVGSPLNARNNLCFRRYLILQLFENHAAGCA